VEKGLVAGVRPTTWSRSSAIPSASKLVDQKIAFIPDRRKHYFARDDARPDPATLVEMEP
jgi:hypothetical protein